MNGAERETADQTARELVFLAGPEDLGLLPDDGINDQVAITVAANGVRRVRLTVDERLAAAVEILTSGGSVRSVCVRLRLPDGTEAKWHKLKKWAGKAAGLTVTVLALGEVIQQISDSLRGNHEQQNHARSYGRSPGRVGGCQHRSVRR